MAHRSLIDYFEVRKEFDNRIQSYTDMAKSTALEAIMAKPDERPAKEARAKEYKAIADALSHVRQWVVDRMEVLSIEIPDKKP